MYPGLRNCGLWAQSTGTKGKIIQPEILLHIVKPVKTWAAAWAQVGDRNTALTSGCRMPMIITLLHTYNPCPPSLSIPSDPVLPPFHFNLLGCSALIWILTEVSSSFYYLLTFCPPVLSRMLHFSPVCSTLYTSTPFCIRPPYVCLPPMFLTKPAAPQARPSKYRSRACYVPTLPALHAPVCACLRLCLVQTAIARLHSELAHDWTQSFLACNSPLLFLNLPCHFRAPAALASLKFPVRVTPVSSRLWCYRNDLTVLNCLAF